MTPIYLTKPAAIEAALAEANGKATAHTLAQHIDLDLLARRAETRLKESGVPKKDWRGIRVVYRPEGPGKAYARKGRCLITTRIVLEYRASGWALVMAERAETWADAKEIFTIRVTEDILNRIRDNACEGYALRKETDHEPAAAQRYADLLNAEDERAGVEAMPACCPHHPA